MIAFALPFNLHGDTSSFPLQTCVEKDMHLVVPSVLLHIVFRSHDYNFIVYGILVLPPDNVIIIINVIPLRCIGAASNSMLTGPVQWHELYILYATNTHDTTKYITLT